MRCMLRGHQPIVILRRGLGELSTGFLLRCECRRCGVSLRSIDPYRSGLPVLVDAFEADVALFGRSVVSTADCELVEMARAVRDPWEPPS